MRRLAIAVALSLLPACGGADRPAGRQIPAAPRVERDLDPTDILPADLDLVVRIDVARMRDGLGPAAAELIEKRAVAESSGEPELAEALACAEVVWIAARAAEIDAGDRVVVIEGQRCMPDLARSRWEKVRSGNGRLYIFDRRGEAPRAGAARIMNLGNKATAFVSPVELDSVQRVLDSGPDPKRGNPRAEGLVSVDLRPRPLPPGLQRRYPSIAAVLGGVERVRGTAVLVDAGVRVDAEVVGVDAAGAARAGKFLEALRDGLREGKFGEAARGAKIDVVDKVVGIKLVVPAKAILGEISRP